MVWVVDAEYSLVCLAAQDRIEPEGKHFNVGLGRVDNCAGWVGYTSVCGVKNNGEVARVFDQKVAVDVEYIAGCF